MENNMWKSIFKVIGPLVILCIGIWIYSFLSNIPKLEPEISIKKIHSESRNDSIFLRRESRGLNYLVTSITTSSMDDYVPDDKRTIFFNLQGRRYFIQENAIHLIVYTYTIATIPSDFESELKIVQIEIERSKVDELEKTYQSVELERF